MALLLRWRRSLSRWPSPSLVAPIPARCAARPTASGCDGAQASQVRSRAACSLPATRGLLPPGRRTRRFLDATRTGPRGQLRPSVTFPTPPAADPFRSGLPSPMGSGSCLQRPPPHQQRRRRRRRPRASNPVQQLLGLVSRGVGGCGCGLPSPPPVAAAATTSPCGRRPISSASVLQAGIGEIEACGDLNCAHQEIDIHDPAPFPVLLSAHPTDPSSSSAFSIRLAWQLRLVS